MKKIKLKGLVVLVAFLLGCGSSPVVKNDASFAETHGKWGWADWTAFDCKIFIMPIEDFPEPKLDHYNAILNHEMEHCDLGRWHDPNPEWYADRSNDPYCVNCHSN